MPQPRADEAADEDDAGIEQDAEAVIPEQHVGNPAEQQHGQHDHRDDQNKGDQRQFRQADHRQKAAHRFPLSSPRSGGSRRRVKNPQAFRRISSPAKFVLRCGVILWINGAAQHMVHDRHPNPPTSSGLGNDEREQGDDHVAVAGRREAAQGSLRAG
ncbi:hypothetical protein BOSEA31B_10531 [Hyphomicrobiales bacterium]|nr:hypothetical protein BOSEA31B_10531 [Hyphomicrobiales bacterium]